MKIITVGALKGGVGKTNVTFNLSCFLAIEKKKRILVIDLDPQGNLTQCFQLDPKKSFASELFLNENLKINNIITNTDFDLINIIPTNILMADLEIKLSGEFGREHKLKNVIKNNTKYLQENYDYILIDTNPSLNITNVNAYSSADSIILVSDNSVHSLRALDTIYQMWNKISKTIKVKNNIKAILLNNFDTFSISKDFKNYLEKGELVNLVVNEEIRKKQIFKNSEITGMPIIKIMKKDENPYFNIVAELEQKGVI